MRQDNESASPYQVIDLPPERRDMPSFFELSWRKHCMYGLLEVDVTIARRFIKEHQAQTGETLSFTGYLIGCLARAVAENKVVQAYLKGRKQLILFDSVDVGLMIERKADNKRVLTGHVIRGAQRKSFWQIHHEIRSIQSTPPPPSRGMPGWFRAALRLPWPLSALFKAVLRSVFSRTPTIPVSMVGTVGITAIGMFGKGLTGWGLSPVMHSLDLIVGSTAWKPVVVEGRVEPREMLNLTVVFDHDVIDGAPATRFTRRLVELIESGYGLGEDQASGPPGG